MPTYKGKFKPKNPSKYRGDPTNIVYRSGWELSVMSWCDTQEDVIAWGSETVVVPYLSPIDGKIHRYFIDFDIQLANGSRYLIEVKPEKQTKPPKKKSKTTRKYIKEVFTYGVNIAKWKAAKNWAEIHGYDSFQVWTERTLKSLGIKIYG